MLDKSLSFKIHLCGNVSHTHTHTQTLTQTHTRTHTLLSCVCMCVVCASVQSIFAPHLLMTLKPTRGGKGLQPGWGGCVSSTLAVRLMSAATATIPLIEEGIVDSTPRQTSYTAGSVAHVVGFRSREIGQWTPHDDSLVTVCSKRRLRVCRSRLKGSFSHFLHICQFIVI